MSYTDNIFWFEINCVAILTLVIVIKKQVDKRPVYIFALCIIPNR